jgi:NTE family protein
MDRNGASGGRRIINLGLQGGGTHGAFTWGVLDRLLEDERLDIEGISAASAGALNAVMLAAGHRRGGAPGARAMLEQFWLMAAEWGQLGLFQRTWLERLQGSWNIDTTPAAAWLEHVNLLVSPYQTNPANRSALRDVLEAMLDTVALGAPDGIKLFIAATNVRTGRPRVFSGSDISIDALMASVCAPHIYQAVVIDGDPYWDGAYTANPTLVPLVDQCQSPDIVLVQVNPMIRDGVPKTATEIVSRLGEIGLNTALLNQLEAIRYVMHLVGRQGPAGRRVAELRRHGLYLHRIQAEGDMRSLGAISQLNGERDFLLYLKDLGRRTAAEWLDANGAALGHRSTFDIEAFLG